MTLAAGTTSAFAVDAYFRDPDNDALDFSISSSTTGVATAEISGQQLTVTAVAKGMATITVTAADTEGLTATQDFETTVTDNQPPRTVGQMAESRV